MIRTALLSAALAAAVLSVPATAHADPLYGGRCTADAAPLEGGAPDQWVVSAEMGPWVIPDADRITMFCYVSLGDTVLDAGDLVLNETTFGPVAPPARVERVDTLTPGSSYHYYLCAHVTWRTTVFETAHIVETDPCRIALAWS